MATPISIHSAPYVPAPAAQPEPYAHLLGRLTELSAERGAGGTSWAAALAQAAQRRGEAVVWVQPEAGSLYPPDLHEAGVELESLVVVRVPGAGSEAAPLLRAAELLVRSGGFGLVVIDVVGLRAPNQVAWQGRLAALARQHHSAVLLLDDRPEQAQSLGPLVALRLTPSLVQKRSGEVMLGARVLKDKGGLHHWPWQLRRRGVPGLVL